MLQVHDAEEELLKREYILKCKIKIKPITYDDVQSKETVKRTEEMAFLLPQDSSERDRFFTAWWPHEETHVELVASVGHPIHGVIRCSFHKGDNRIDRPYIFVMTKSAEEALKALDGKDLIVTIHAQGDEHKADMMKDYDLSANKNRGQYVDKEKGVEL